MSENVSRASASLPLERKPTSAVVRWLLGVVFVGLALIVLLAAGGAIFAIRMWAEDRAAAKAVKAEVTRLQAAGFPMSSDDLYRAHQVPADAADTTPAWLAAIKSCEAGLTNNDAKGIPYVGDGEAALLRLNSSNSQLAAAEQFLLRHDSTLQTILSAAGQRGECRIPVKFEQGFGTIGPDAQKIRPLVRLLALAVHVHAARGEADKAIDSLAAMFAASDAISHQRTIVEQLIRLATLGSALGQTQLVVNELELTDEQLARLEKQLAETDIQASFRRSLIGERAGGYEEFEEFAIIRTVGRQGYLEMMGPLIAFSSQPLPAGRRHALSLLAQIGAQQKAASGWQRNKYVLTARLVPSLAASFDAYASAVAYRDALLTAIAAERYRLKLGRFPVQLAELTPDYLVGVPVDPFDGQPLRFRAEGKDFLIYSIGRDGKDDGGQNSPGKSSEPDIVVRISSDKTKSQ